VIACLLPVRNGAEDLPAFLRSAAQLADVVVALDDGSTDATARLLEGSPLVHRMLRNPPRKGFMGWDDHANRQRLLDAAADLAPDWVVFLDVDERLDAEDALAFRQFLERDAVPGCAYGLQLFSASGARVLPRPTYVYRAFAFAPGLRLPRERLHFNPVPTSIPTAAWIPTTIRFRHLESPERIARRVAKYRDADPHGEWERGGSRGDGPSGLVPWQRRPSGMPVLAPDRPSRFDGSRPDVAPRLACLLPARNCEADLPGYLDSAGLFADAVVALDDGSTDETAELLAESPLVVELLRNPPRRDYAGWDDAANRARLLDAARARGFDWILFLDADERIAPDDVDPLRELLTSVDSDCAYGFRVYRMIGDLSHYDRSELWVYRLFSPMVGGALPRRRLHLVPVPDSIPRSRWRKTTIRIQHLASLTRERRTARLRKYEQADPERRWQRDYRGLMEVGMERRTWQPRPQGFPLLADPLGLGPGAEIDLASLDPGAPVLSAIVIARNDEATIERSVRSVVEQDCPVPFEVVVAASGHDSTAELVRERFPQVKVVEVPEPGLPGMARNAGLAVARGEYVSFPGSHVELSSGSLAARVRAHELGYSMVTGTILNGTPTRAGWASYFLDHSGALPARPSGELAAPPARCSYSREALMEVGGFAEDMRAGEDTVVNDSLWRRGHRAYRSCELRLVHRSRCSTPAALARHHFVRGRALGRILLDRSGAGRSRRRLASFAFSYPRRRLAATDERVGRWGNGLRAEYRRVRPLVWLGILSAWTGLLWELAAPSRVARASIGKLGENPSADRDERGAEPLMRDSEDADARAPAVA
jgi:glycosyltransferase involved in cell wall biosynthesis